VSIFDREKQFFRFHPGPIFSQVVLADEINRATPKAQSALLEAMEERQVTTEGESRPLPEPFFVIATQNPAHQVGTFPLPESQLDRFLLRVEIGYPHPAAERELLSGEDRRDLLAGLGPVMTTARLTELQKQVKGIFVAAALLDYCQDLLAFSRTSSRFRHGLSPRAGLSLLRAAKAWAFLHGRAEVIPEDLQEVIPAAVSHRLQLTADSGAAEGRSAAEHLLRSVPVP